MRKVPKKRANLEKESTSEAEMCWPDPQAKKRWPWTTRLWEVQNLLQAIGEPFVRVVQTGPTSRAIYHVWERGDLSGYGKLPAPEGELVRFEGLLELLRTPPFRKLPPAVRNWIHSVKEQSVRVALAAADIAGCIHYLEQQIEIRQALIANLDKIKVPEIPFDLNKAIRTECASSYRLLGNALKQAKRAQAHLAPCTERFLHRRSSSRKQEEQWLRGMIERSAKFTRNHSAQLAHSLLACLDEYFVTTANALRQGSYDVSPPKSDCTRM